MPDQRRRRGPHPEDHRLFGPEQTAPLQSAVADMSWLLSRGYAHFSSLKLVGDRYRLDARQRTAVTRSACSDEHSKQRRSRELAPSELAGEEIWIDGYNVLTSIEAALSGGVLLLARDGCLRDMASMHGSYRKVDETTPALELLGRSLAAWGAAGACWWLDQPVSNSGRLKAIIADIAERRQWNWRVELTPDPDPVLAQCSHIVASADSQILDAADRWFNLARRVVELHVPDAWMVDLGGSPYRCDGD